MLTLNDGRSELWQWDTGRKLTVDADCTQVHFSNKFFGRSVDVDVVDGVAEIPDVLLQADKELLVWAFVGTAENGYTKISKAFKVNKRNKPADYVFTPTEQTTLDEIMKRLSQIEESQDPDAIKNAVDDYLSNNPIEIDETDPTVPEWAKQPTKPKYTAKEVGAVATVNGTAPDENGNVEIEIPEASEPDMTGYATERYVQENYQQKGNYLTKVPEGYAKAEDIPTRPEDIGAQPSGNYALKSEIPSVPVQSVNGKTGKVQLGAADVGARPSNWMPTAQEVGALPDTYVPPDQTAAQVGADPAGTAAAAVSAHNTSTDSHGDLRLELKAINDRLTAFFDSDNQTLDELSEIVAYITSNKALIDSITTSKVSVADIINNLTTNVANKPLSAAQGVVLKDLIDAVSNSLSNYQPKGDYALRSELPTVPTKVSQLENDKGYLTEHQDISGKVDKVGLTLGRHADGLLYVFVDGQPVGNGVDLPAGGIDGYITPDKQIVFNNLPDGEYTLAYINDDGSIVPIGAMEKDTNVYYTVTNTLTNCVSSNSASEAIKGEGYAATITANDGYELSSVVVTMGGEDISADVVSDGTITIGSVSGNIVVTAVAEVAAVKVINQLPISTDASGNPFVGTNGEAGYKTGFRLSISSGNESAATGLEVTGYIPVKLYDTVYLRDITVSSADTKQTVVYYDADYNVLGGCYTGGAWGDTNGEVVSVQLKSSTFNNAMTNDVAFIRITAGEITADSVITVNQEITADTVVS